MTLLKMGIFVLAGTAVTVAALAFASYLAGAVG